MKCWMVSGRWIHQPTPSAHKEWTCLFNRRRALREVNSPFSLCAPLGCCVFIEPEKKREAGCPSLYSAWCFNMAQGSPSREAAASFSYFFGCALSMHGSINRSISSFPPWSWASHFFSLVLLTDSKAAISINNDYIDESWPPCLQMNKRDRCQQSSCC